MDQTIDKNIISDKCTRMPPKLSPIWKYFEEDTNDPSTAIYFESKKIVHKYLG